MAYSNLEKFVLSELGERLSPKLTYHGLHHTKDVIEVCKNYCVHYDLDQKQEELLKVGALMHDCGFLKTYDNHEDIGVEISKRILPDYGYNQKDIEIVSGLIMATQVPQKPKNFLEKIICDADLDYLGRPDFYQISESLFEELKHFMGLKDRTQWNQIQVNFFESHSYHTEWAKIHRSPIKEAYLEELKKQVEASR